ncbi:MAG TPA: hypothetical protein V6D06_21215 [Trichocoleus sp.]
MVNQLEPTHPQHPHHLECPRCRRHTVVVHGESRYVCLSCNWERNVEEWEPLPWLAPILFLLLLLLFI